MQSLSSPLQRIGGGREKKLVDGKLIGPHYQKQPRRAVNFYAVDVRRVAEDIANALRQHSSAQHFATVVDFALEPNIVLNELNISLIFY